VEYEDNPRRTPRYSFAANIEVTDVESGMLIRGRTRDLALFGCGADTKNPFPKGTRVRIKIAYAGSNFEAFGLVVYGRPDLGMGIVFTNVRRKGERILEEWLGYRWGQTAMIL
jgi:hypothetical protein